MMAATILCLVASVPDGTTIRCSNGMTIGIAGLETGPRVPKTAQGVLSRLTLGQKVACLPAGNKGPYIEAKCTLPDRRDLACTLIRSHTAIRSDVAWRRYGLAECE